MLKISTKFGVAAQSFCENQNSVQNQDQDQDHDITLDFNTRPTFHTEKTPTKFFLDSLLLRKLFCPHEKSTYVRRSRHQDRQTDRQTDGDFFCLFCLLRHTNHEHFSKGENFFFTHAVIILSLFTYSVCDEKVKNRGVSVEHRGVCVEFWDMINL